MIPISRFLEKIRVIGITGKIRRIRIIQKIRGISNDHRKMEEVKKMKKIGGIREIWIIGGIGEIWIIGGSGELGKIGKTGKTCGIEKIGRNWKNQELTSHGQGYLKTKYQGCTRSLIMLSIEDQNWSHPKLAYLAAWSVKGTYRGLRSSFLPYLIPLFVPLRYYDWIYSMPMSTDGNGHLSPSMT